MNVSAPRFPLFDSLRAIAALSVFAVHLPLVAAMSEDHFPKRHLSSGTRSASAADS